MKRERKSRKIPTWSIQLNVRWSNGGNLPYITCLPRRCLQTVWLNRLQPQHSWISGGCWTLVVDLIGNGSWLPKVGVLNRCLAPSLLYSVVERRQTLDILIRRLYRLPVLETTIFLSLLLLSDTCRSLSVITKDSRLRNWMQHTNHVERVSSRM